MSALDRRLMRHAREAQLALAADALLGTLAALLVLARTFGSYLLNRGLRLEVVSRLLGHTSTVVTERAYAELLGSTIREELLAVFADKC